MKVLVVGFCKTGTKSVEKALEILGYDVADYASLNFKHFDRWKRFMEGNGSLEDLAVMYESVDAVGDMPVNMYWKEMLKVFPEMKLILMVRDEESWLKSWHKHWRGRNTGLLSMPLAFFSTTARKYIKFMQLEAQTFFNASPKSFRKMYQDIPDEDLKRVYRQHNRSILENAPSDQLLVLELRRGWKPLCEFLGKVIPNIGFPHCNKNAGLLKDQHAHHPLFQRMYYEMFMTLSALLGSIFILIYLMFFLG